MMTTYHGSGYGDGSYAWSDFRAFGKGGANDYGCGEGMGYGHGYGDGEVGNEYL